MRQIGLLISVILLSVACAPESGESSDAELVEVVDGDTLRMRIDGAIEEVRLVGLNTPERGECFSAEATAGMERLVAGALLRFEKAGGDETDRFGRLLGYVYTNDVLANLEMVRTGSGLAVVGDHPRVDEFAAATDAAWQERAGMWNPNACGVPSTDEVRIDVIEADPPGDDNDRLNDEFIVLHNAGPDSADMSGWMIRDESSTNRYTVPEGTVLTAGARVIVHTGCGVDTASDLYWCSGPVWSNRGDTAIVQAPSGTVVDRLSYGNT